MAAAAETNQITQLLHAWHDGDDDARESLMTLVYGHVRAIAAQSLRQSPGGATLTPTEIAHEALLRLLGSDANWQDRRHFFHVIAQATRQVLVDAARRRYAGKRGGAAEHVDIDAAEHVASRDADTDLLRVDAALSDLARSDGRRARAIELAYFGGFSREEIATALDVSEGTVDRDLRLARAWLKQALTA